MRALVPYAGKPRSDHARSPAPAAPLSRHLSFMGEKSALMLFRIGNDSTDIAGVLHCTPAAAANGIANARDRERAQARVEQESTR